MLTLRRNGLTGRRELLRMALGASALALSCGPDKTVGLPSPGGPGPGVGPGVGGGEPDAGVPDAGIPPQIDQPEAVPESLHFPLGVASGDVTDQAIVLWTRYAHTRALRIRVWDGEAPEYTRLLELPVAPEGGGFVNLVLEGLSPSTRYRFAFLEWEGDQPVGRSPIGYFRTAASPGALEVVTLGAVSCTRQGRSIQTLGRAAEREDLHAFLLLGDTSYNDGADTVETYREKWAESLSRGEYRALRARHPVIATWDDHEVDNGWNPETVDEAKKAAAYSTFFESLPVRRSAQDPRRIWRSFRFGDTVEVFVLDSRGERTPSTKADYLSRAQMDWLKAGLKQSAAVFKLVMTSVPIGQFPFSAFSDGWTDYGAQRDELLQFIGDEALAGVLFVSGDFHFASLGRVSSSGPGSDLLEILAGPGGQLGNVAEALLTGPQWDWASSQNNFAALTFDPASREVTASFVNGDGDVIQERTYPL